MEAGWSDQQTRHQASPARGVGWGGGEGQKTMLRNGKLMQQAVEGRECVWCLATRVAQGAEKDTTNRVDEDCKHEIRCLKAAEYLTGRHGSRLHLGGWGGRDDKHACRTVLAPQTML